MRTYRYDDENEWYFILGHFASLVTIINAVIRSKVWYIAHTFPPTKKYCKLINKELFPFIWSSKYNPIQQDVIYQSRLNGGLGLFNVYHKAQRIMTATFLKQFLESNEHANLLKYYCSIGVNPLLKIRNLPEEVLFISPKYFTDLISMSRKLSHCKNYPNINSNIIYESLLPECSPVIENKININWKTSWANLSFRYINIHERELMFKHMHGILPTKLRLYQMKHSVSINVIHVIKWKITYICLLNAKRFMIL